MEAYYPGRTAESLSNTEKSNISAISTLAAGLAGGVAGNSTNAAGTGAVSGKVAVENNSLAGDKARESVKESKEYWKEKVRETMGENLGSQMTNGLINFAAETGDLAMFGGDAGYDLALALGTCATGNSYCGQAQSDLAKKDAAAAGMLSAMMNGDAWEGISTTVVKAWNGDQRALENVAGILTGIMVPAKALSPGGKGSSVAESTAARGTSSETASSKPEWLQNVQAGNKFNAEQSKNYPYNEMYVNKPDGSGYYRVDSYNPATGEIVSRKFTQFSDITETAANNYIREAVNKYPAGATIAKVPSSGSLAGRQLEGINILEIPPQAKPIPQSILDSAKKANVVIRDTSGKVYK